ncbi:MAG: 30S ribosomal protein S3 [Thermodesulfobacteriota bacterium]
MGQKVNPKGFRLGIIKTWDSRWYATKHYARWVVEDTRLRQHIKQKLFHAQISNIEIERVAGRVRVTIHSSRPGIIIGKKGGEVENLKNELQKITDKEVTVNIQEVRRPELDAQLVGEGIALQLARRVSYRRAMKRAVQQAMRLGAQGIRVSCAGRLSGAEMARREWYREGRVPLHTLRADIDYATAISKTTYGIIGVKVWIYKGDVMPQDQAAS